MRNLFRAQPDIIDNTGTANAAIEGRVDERRPVDVGSATPVRPNRAEIDLAYERGRARERGARRGSPILALLVLVLVVAGGASIYLAAKTGSFSSGGALVDQKLDTAAHTVSAPLKNAAEATGAALQKAGQSLK